MLRIPAVAGALLAKASASTANVAALCVDIHRMLVNYCRHSALVPDEHGCVRGARARDGIPNPMASIMQNEAAADVGIHGETNDVGLCRR